MAKRSTIRKIVSASACLLAGGGITTLLIAANRREAAHYCQRIDITVKASGEKLYITKSDILAQLADAAARPIVQQRIETIDLARLEKHLEQHQWIRDAELYFDAHDVLHVAVAEREPIARVFTTAGNSFYLDSAGSRLPLMPDINIRVPVVTAFTGAAKWGKRDSAVVKDLTTIAQYIISNPFWNAQIAEIDVTPAGTFELVPVVGNSIIRIGRSDNLAEKLANLKLFYQQVLRRTGLDTYPVIDVQYKDQVIGSHARNTNTIDSVQLQRNIQELMRRTKQQAEADSIAAVSAAAQALADSATAVEPPPTAAPPVPATTTPAPRTSTPPARKPSNPDKPAPSNIKQKTASPQKSKPKAVMPKRDKQR